MPFPSSLVPLFQSKSKCRTILTKNLITACRAQFHMKSFALRLVLKLRHKRIQEWPSFLLCVVVQGSPSSLLNSLILPCIIITEVTCWKALFCLPYVLKVLSRVVYKPICSFYLHEIFYHSSI